jgi:hypothetical protein
MSGECSTEVIPGPNILVLDNLVSVVKDKLAAERIRVGHQTKQSDQYNCPRSAQTVEHSGRGCIRCCLDAAASLVN